MTTKTDHSIKSNKKPLSTRYNPYERFENTELILRDQLAIDRTVLANERTLLAYARTSLALIVTGTGAIRFFDGWSAHITGWGLIAFGVAVFPFGLYRFFTTNWNVGTAGRISKREHEAYRAMHGAGDGI